ncbi:MAG: glycosyltransferase [Flavobacteriaceae bacterium]|jgi:glycosyltransferase involved in cell wall biosynthesis|nr:glycosyltransferase [Flavobacteriaceae bacterium]
MRKKRKVLFFLHTMRGGGVENVLLNIFQNLSHEKFDFTLLLIRKEGDFYSFIPKNVKIKYLALGNECFSKNKIIYIIQKIFRRIKLTILLRFPLLIRWFYIPEYYDAEIAFLADLIPYLNKIKREQTFTVGWVHGDIYADKHDFHKKINILKSSLRLDKIVYVSKKALENGLIWNSDLKKNAIVIYNPIDKDIIVKNAQENIEFNYVGFTFVCVGRLGGIKGYDAMLEVHKKLIDEGVHHHIIVVGKGEDEQILKSSIKRLGVEKTFHLLGHMQNPFPYLKRADAFLQNSKSEGYPLAVKEALLLGKPMVVTGVGGVPEIVINNENAIIIDHNQDQLYQAMKKIIRDVDFRHELEANNQKHFQEYDTKKIYKQYENLLNVPK